MKTTVSDKWVYYTADNFKSFLGNSFGKWMFYFDNPDYAEQICTVAVRDGVTKRAKHANASQGIGGFYTTADNYTEHRTIIAYMLRNNLIRRAANGKYFDIAFKYELADDEASTPTLPRTSLRLSDFIDLSDGTFKPVRIQQCLC